MSQIRTDITDDAGVAALPVGQRSKDFYLGRGLHVVVLPTGKRRFVVYSNTQTTDGWIQSVPVVIGYWPTVSLASAQAYATRHRHHRPKREKRAPEPSTPRKTVLLQDALQTPWTHNEE